MKGGHWKRECIGEGVHWRGSALEREYFGKEGSALEERVGVERWSALERECIEEGVHWRGSALKRECIGRGGMHWKNA